MILDWIMGYKIPLLESPFQMFEPKQLKLNENQNKVVSNEVQSMLDMGVIRSVKPERAQIISNLFLREKKEKGQYRPILNLKPLNQFVPYEKFKMETLRNVQELLQPGDLLVKIDLKHAYYSVNLAEQSRKLVRFRWNGNQYEYLSLVFGLGPAPRVFTKILKVPMTLLRNLNFRIIIFIDDMLIMGKSLKEIEMARDTTLFLLQNLGFVINWEKSALTPSKTIEFLGIRINSSNMTFAIPEKKTQSILQLCQETLDKPQISLRKLARIVGKLMSTAQAFTPAPIQVRFLQNLLRRNLSSESYETKCFCHQKTHQKHFWNYHGGKRTCSCTTQ